jgi:hypothetical protein
LTYLQPRGKTAGEILLDNFLYKSHGKNQQDATV